MTKWAKLKLGIKLESHVAKLSGKVKRSGEADEAGEINSQKKVWDAFSTKKYVPRHISLREKRPGRVLDEEIRPKT